MLKNVPVLSVLSAQTLHRMLWKFPLDYHICGKFSSFHHFKKLNLNYNLQRHFKKTKDLTVTTP